MSNTWPEGRRRALHQHEHEAWNASNYPGTRQLCSECDEPTGRCEEDTISHPATDEPICESCYKAIEDESCTNFEQLDC